MLFIHEYRNVHYREVNKYAFEKKIMYIKFDLCYQILKRNPKYYLRKSPETILT